MKFLVDECVGPTVAKWLQQQNYDVVSIYDETPGINDNEVFKRAVNENRILITNDKDFGEMVFKNNMSHCGIVLLRLIDQRPMYKIQILETALKTHAKNFANNFVVITETTIRIIKPPIS